MIWIDISNKAFVNSEWVVHIFCLALVKITKQKSPPDGLRIHQVRNSLTDLFSSDLCMDCKWFDTVI